MLVALISHLITADPERSAAGVKSTLCLVALVAVILWCLPPVPVRLVPKPKLSVKERRRERDQRRADNDGPPGRSLRQRRADNAAERDLASMERELLTALRPNAHRRRRAV
jgi:hypothetical protein